MKGACTPLTTRHVVTLGSGMGTVGHVFVFPLGVPPMFVSKTAPTVSMTPSRKRGCGPHLNPAEVSTQPHPFVCWNNRHNKQMEHSFAVASELRRFVCRSSLRNDRRVLEKRRRKCFDSALNTIQYDALTLTFLPVSEAPSLWPNFFFTIDR